MPSRPALSALIVAAMAFTSSVWAQPLAVRSPDGQIAVALQLNDRGQLTFDVKRAGAAVADGTLGLAFAEGGALSEHLAIAGTRTATGDETYAIPVGKTSSARDHHNELVVELAESQPSQRRLEVAVRVFDDGVAFRYQIPEQPSVKDFVITDELTRIHIAPQTMAKYLPLRSYTTPYEWYYDEKTVSAIDPKQLIGLPILLQPTAGKAWCAITEADLTDYAGMYLSRDANDTGTFVSKLSPLPGRTDGAKVLGRAPFNSPWRVLMIGDSPGALIESNIVFNLNAPSKIADPSWIKPGKTMFPWWNHYVDENVDFTPGVNTATMKHYIDFAAANGIETHTLDGLDVAWYGGPIDPTGPVDLTKGGPGMDVDEVVRYAKQKGVRLRVWVHIKALRPQLEKAFAAWEQWGIDGVMVDFMERDDQEMVRYYHELAETAAKHHLTLNIHGAYKPTGMERTWPNVLNYEAALNQEYNKWQPPGVHGTPPQHNLDIAFVRMLAGPLDYHQGGMRNVLPENYHFRDVAPPVQGTRGHQLGMYVVYQNGLPMLADYPEAYRDQPGFEFLRRVPANWDETRVLVAELDKCIVIARREGDTWYVGGMTATEPRSLELPLTFLKNGSFTARLWQDDPNAGPTVVTQSDQPVKPDGKLKVEIPKSGGFAAIITTLKQ